YGQQASVVATYPYPTEGEQDTFYCAAGGAPDHLVGGISRPGAFHDFAFDTLDYRFSNYRTGIPLAVLGRYKVVAWYTDNFSSGLSSDPLFGGQFFSTDIRYANTAGHLNTLAAYLSQGGKAFIFGEGMTPAIANGFFNGVPFIPYSNSPAVARNYVL